MTWLIWPIYSQVQTRLLQFPVPMTNPYKLQRCHFVSLLALEGYKYLTLEFLFCWVPYSISWQTHWLIPLIDELCFLPYRFLPFPVLVGSKVNQKRNKEMLQRQIRQNSERLWWFMVIEGKTFHRNVLNVILTVHIFMAHPVIFLAVIHGLEC